MKRRFAVVLAVLMALALIMPMNAMAMAIPIQSDVSTIISMTPTSIATISPVNPALVGAYNITYEIDSTSTAYGQIYTTTAAYGTYTNVPVAKVTALTAGTLKINAKLGGASGITVGSTTVTVRSLLASGAATMSAGSNTLTYGQSTQITSSSGQAIVAATSSETSISVSSTGLVTCRSTGTGYADIGCYDAAGNYGNVRIFFGNYPTNTVSSTSTRVAVGGTLQLYLGGTPDHCGSSNEAVATVSQTGLVTGKANGTATIYCINSTTGATGSFTVTVGTGVGGATGSGVYPLKANIAVGESTMLTGASIISAYTANSNVVSVTSNGLITGLSNGTAAITYVTSTGVSGTATVVVGSATGGVALAKSNIAVGETTMITGATLAMAYSGNNAVATVTTSGIVTGISAGTATITYVTTTGTNGTVTVTVGATTGTTDPNLPAPTKSYTIAAGSYKTFKYSGQSVAKAWAADPSVVSASLITGSDGYAQARFTGVSGGTTTVYMQTANGAMSAITFVVTGGSVSSGTTTGSSGIITTGDPDLSVICRKGAGSSYGVRATLRNGVKVKVTGTEGEYYKVSFTSGSKTYSGYVKAKYVSVS